MIIKKIILISMFFACSLNAQEFFQESGMRMPLQKIVQKGTSGLTFANEDGTIQKMDLLNDASGGPGIAGFHNHVFAYNRFMFCSGLEVGTRNLSAKLSDSSRIYGAQTRYIYVSRFVLSIPLEAGLLGLKSRRSLFRLYTSAGLFTELTAWKKVEGNIPVLNDFVSSYCQDNRLNIVPYIRIRLRFNNTTTLSYNFGYLSKRSGTARINFIEHGFSLIFCKLS